MNVLRYTDKILNDETKIPGFGTLYKQEKARDVDRALNDKITLEGWFEIPSENVRNEDQWVLWFNGVREERFVYQRKIRSSNAFYRFLKSNILEDYNPEGIGDEYFYCIPRGFTKSSQIHFEDEEDLVLKSRDGRSFKFSKVRKVTEGIGICILE